MLCKWRGGVEVSEGTLTAEWDLIQCLIILLLNSEVEIRSLEWCLAAFASVPDEQITE